MAYSSWSVIFGEQPSASKWNILGTNDAHFYTYAGEGTNAIQQVQMTQYSEASTTTTIIPFDDTIPQNTEGAEFMSQTITPKSASNLLVIEGAIMLNNTVVNWYIAALFQDSTANALAAYTSYSGVATGALTIPFKYKMTAGTTSATTFKIRGGGPSAGTTTFNGQSGTRRFGAIPKSYIQVTEFKV